jgi:D-serine deaminase-like pyridoxal phosphate-dependent protein
VRQEQLAEAVDTPAVVVDLARLRRNVEAYADVARSAGVDLRPHVKTHKTLEIARLQRDAGATGLTVAKLSEADVYAHAGFDDIFVAYPVIGTLKWERAAALAETCRLTVGVDSQVGIEGLGKAAAARGSVIHVRVEFDSGLHRSGAALADVAELCRKVLDQPALRLDGIFTFRSSAFDGSAGRTVTDLGTSEGELLASTAALLRDAGLPIKAVSGGSTPTGAATAACAGVTEIRPGTYVFQDRMTIADGVATNDDAALTVLTTVVSRPSDDIAIIDAGSKTLAADVWPEDIGLRGHAEVAGGGGYVVWLNEEHGAVRLLDGYRPRVGETMQLIPNHVCTVVNLSEELVVVEGTQVVDRWSVAAGRCRT